ncbi:MAG TPA: N-acetylmuramoyl-L-alanine amidase-like domain-containing protein, partial [Gemmatimonadales bacterium]
MARIGERFVGADYIPSTLEVPGPERLVINLRAFDCVTFVENVIALAWFVRRDGAAALADPAQARRRYEAYLTTLRYRDGAIAGYPSRLHYFSEWLGDNARRGNLDVVSNEFGSRLDDEPIGFMSAHPASYRQMAEPGVPEAIRATEARLNAAGGRRMVPEQEIADVAGQIRDGDVIAATSTLPGLDIAHTGLAVWRDGRLHLLHAPLVGKSVELSDLPLADRIVSIKAQDGIMVGRVSP